MSLDRKRMRAELLRKRREQAEADREAPNRTVGLFQRRKDENSLSSDSPIHTSVAVDTGPVDSGLDRKRRINAQLNNPVQYAEINRIIKMPIIESFTKEDTEEFNREHVLGRAYEDGFRMWPVQCEAIHAFQQFDGLFAPIGVGWGKTMITQAIANAAYQAGLQKIMLCIPSQVLVQLMKSDFPFARKRIPINYPVHILGGRPMGERRSLAKSGKKGLYILPYSCLSTKDAHENLYAVSPELIICDEADYLGNRRAARTKRLMNYVADKEPLGACLSGTITSKSIKDYYHLIKWCLGQSCPLPLSTHLASEWAVKIDAQAVGGESTGPIAPLCIWAQNNFPDEDVSEDVAGFRLAYKLRLKTAPGVVATGDAEIGPSLIIHNSRISNEDMESCDGWDQLEVLRTRVVDEWCTPNGDEIEHSIHMYKWLFELTSGFYNELTFPTPEVFAEREGVSFEVAESIMWDARIYHQAGQTYAKELRSWIEENARPGLDTPMLLGLDMANNGPKHVGNDLFNLWIDHHELGEALTNLMVTTKAHTGTERELSKKISRSLRDARVVRVCPHKINHAVQWADSLKEGAILWVWHKGIGEWLTEALHKVDLNPLYCPAGAQHNATILEPKNRKRIIVASMKAHGTGKNLQAFNQQLFVQWPRSAKIAEQTLGRMHRNGQQAAEVWANTCNSSEFDDLCFAATLNDALYIHQTTGNRQKLIYGTYSPGLPKVFPVEVLRERGFQNRKLDAKQRKLLSERFGT